MERTKSRTCRRLDMGDWIDDLFDGNAKNDYADHIENARRLAARLCRTTTLEVEEKDEIIGMLLDYDTPMNVDEIQDIIVRMQINQQDPMQFYAPSKREIASFIKKVCDL
jgi:hypothetical protein